MNFRIGRRAGGRISAVSPVIAAVLLLLVLPSSGAQAGEVTALHSGNWSDPEVWSTGTPPGPGDSVVVTQGVHLTYDVAHSRVNGVRIESGATLAFAPDQSATLETDRNVLVAGRLRLRPASRQQHHVLRFIGVDETRFVGGGMQPLASDIGLWVVGRGILDAVGTARTAWVRAETAIPAGARSLRLDRLPVGWRPGDRLVVTPTQPLDAGRESWDGFDRAVLASVDDTRVTLRDPVEHLHPEGPAGLTAEVLNLTRNVTIEGTGAGDPDPKNNGRAHIWIHSERPQTIRYVGLRHLGPRHDSDGNGITDLVHSRYALHFHHMGEAARGSLVEGVVAEQIGNHSFAPHASHGVTIRHSIAFDVWESAFWWDPPPERGDTSNDTHDTRWVGNVVGLVRADPSFRGFTQTAYTLGAGTGNVIRNSVAVGVRGNKNASGFHWPSNVNHNPNVWTFEDNVAHNNKADGVFVWQNTGTGPHLVDGLTAYRNGDAGIDHGAYLNAYQYRATLLEGNGTAVRQHALPANAQGRSGRPDGYVTVFDGLSATSELVLTKHNLGSSLPTLYRDCSFSRIVVDEEEHAGLYDFVGCGLERQDIELRHTLPGMRIRVQRGDGSAFQVHTDGSTMAISPFYPQGEAGRHLAGQGPVRLEGPTRIETAIAVAGERFPEPASADTVVLARGDDPDGYVDALAGTPLAARLSGPLLITDPDRLHPSVAAEIRRVLSRGATVHLLGGRAALSPEVEDRVQELGFRTRRTAGATREETAVEVARLLGEPAVVLLATGRDFPDALAAGAAAAHLGGVVLLTDGSRPHAATTNYLADHPEAATFAVGHPAAAAHPDAVPLAGPSREATATTVADQIFGDPARVALVRSNRFPDALAGGSHAGALGVPVLLTTPGDLHQAVASHLCDRSGPFRQVLVYGGERAVTGAVANEAVRRGRGEGCP